MEEVMDNGGQKFLDKEEIQINLESYEKIKRLDNNIKKRKNNFVKIKYYDSNNKNYKSVTGSNNFDENLDKHIADVSLN